MSSRNGLNINLNFGRRNQLPRIAAIEAEITRAFIVGLLHSLKTSNHHSNDTTWHSNLCLLHDGVQLLHLPRSHLFCK
uniref:Uncharacterized protein n=1 Tax=Mesocestoides corti TaxID=53468 RepID=A0A5K3EYP9_MESCO